LISVLPSLAADYFITEIIMKQATGIPHWTGKIGASNELEQHLFSLIANITLHTYLGAKKSFITI